MQTLIDPLRLDHEIRQGVWARKHMRRSKSLSLRQTPSVEFMDRNNTVDFLEVVLNIFECDAEWDGFKEDRATVFYERNRWQKNHDSNTHAHAWISVESTFVVGFPDHGWGDDDADIVDCVANDVNQDAHHAEIVAMASFGSVDFVAVIFVRVVSGALDGIQLDIITLILDEGWKLLGYAWAVVMF